MSDLAFIDILSRLWYSPLAIFAFMSSIPMQLAAGQQCSLVNDVLTGWKRKRAVFHYVTILRWIRLGNIVDFVVKILHIILIRFSWKQALHLALSNSVFRLFFTPYHTCKFIRIYFFHKLYSVFVDYPPTLSETVQITVTVTISVTLID